MVSTARLEDEYGAICQVLSCLDQMADACLRECTLDRRAALAVVDFLQTVGDRRHRAGPATCRLPPVEAEHDHERWLLGALAADIDGTAAGCTDARWGFVTNARAFTQLLRRHIETEDALPCPAAGRAGPDPHTGARF